jgi:hypothetical protein
MNQAASTSNAARRGPSGPGLAAARLLLAGLATLCVRVAAQESQEPPADTQTQGQPQVSEEAEQQPQPGQPPIAAVWKEQRLSFTYSSGSTVYSCSALAGRVASLLRAVGARDDVKVRVSGCSNSMMPDPGMSTPGGSRSDPMTPVSERYRYQGTVASNRQFASVFINAMLPVEVTGDVRAELEKDKSRRELVARVTGNPAARFNDPILFAAERQQVTLSNETVGIEPEECELVDQLTSTVLPRMDVRVVSRGDTLCSTDSLLAPRLVVEALLPVQYGASSVPQLPQQPPPGDDEEEDADPPVR